MRHQWNDDAQRSNRRDRCVNKFDSERGFKFSTYACRAILKSFYRYGSKQAKYRQRAPHEFDPERAHPISDGLRHHDGAIRDPLKLVVDIDDRQDAANAVLGRVSHPEQLLCRCAEQLRPISIRGAGG